MILFKNIIESNTGYIIGSLTFVRNTLINNDISILFFMTELFGSLLKIILGIEETKLEMKKMILPVEIYRYCRFNNILSADESTQLPIILSLN